MDGDTLMTEEFTEICIFCHQRNAMVFCHEHYHCSNCGMNNYECCSGEQVQKGVQLKFKEEDDNTSN